MMSRGDDWPRTNGSAACVATPFFLAGDYLVDGQSDTLLFVSVSLPS